MWSPPLQAWPLATPSTPLLGWHDRPRQNAISLATWSIVRSFRAGLWKLTDVARICREDFAIDGIEYVTSFFEVPVQSYLRKLNQAAAEAVHRCKGHLAIA